jgi:ion channel-forming bestrophin family protein
LAPGRLPVVNQLSKRLSKLNWTGSIAFKASTQRDTENAQADHWNTSLSTTDHMPTAVTQRLAEMLRTACENKELDGFAFMQLDQQRADLMDHLGGCECILKTPLALAYSIKIRRFIILFLVTLPFALIHSLGECWLVPFVTMLIAYPLLSMDQLGAELQNPFDTRNLSHLPLDEISAGIERNIMALNVHQMKEPADVGQV